MTPEERAADILKRCWWQEERDGPRPEFRGLDVEISGAIRDAVSTMLAALERLLACPDMSAIELLEPDTIEAIRQARAAVAQAHGEALQTR